jgi:hypothetical protein
MKKYLQRRFFFTVGFLFLAAAGLQAAEFINGSLRLVLHEDTGRFSLYRVNDEARIRYEPFFSDQDPRTSLFTLSINNRVYKLGDVYSFEISLRPDPNRPAFIFSSPNFLVTEEFVFIKMPGSDINNGIAVNISIYNRSSQKADVGLRFLLDTNLGERGTQSPFVTDVRPIASETLIEKGSPESYWISQNAGLSLMGSLTGSTMEGPDSVMFANWKRLNEAPFKAPYTAGRNFNSPPYSVEDSAVCYLFEPRSLGKGETRVCSFTLAAGNDRGYNPPAAAAPPAAAPASLSSEEAAARQRDLAIIQVLITQIDTYIASGRVSEAELSAMEEALTRLLEKYGQTR